MACYKFFFILALILIIYKLETRVEGIVFNAPYLYKYYRENGITILPNKQLLKKGDKIASYEFGFNKPKSKLLSKDKFKTKQVLIKNNIPTPNYYYWNKSIDMNQNINLLQQKLRFPIVIKPNDLEQGSNVFSNILDIESARTILKKLLRKTNNILIEEYIEGNPHRIFVFNDNIIAAYEIMRPYVIGDGKSTLIQLINALIRNSEKSMDIQQVDNNYIKEQGFTLSSIIPKNQKVVITHVANGTIGATPKNISISDIHPANISLFKKINQVMDLTSNGIDYITYDLNIPYYTYGSVLETNAKPGLGEHYNTVPESMDKFVKLIPF